ncbi:unnamed protein product, partial [Lymnaea stagnalis]
MGCGSSKSTGAGGDGAPKQSGARNDNPPIDPINVPDLDPKYPAPTPPPNGRDQIYKPAEYSAIDARVKQQLNSIRPTTYDALIKSLCANCTTDLQKLRAIMVWLFHQDIYGSFYNGVTDPYTPRGYMKLMKQGSGSYESFFTQLCRAAGIQCVVIRGVAKGDKYDVGQQDMTQLESAWNGVYVAGGWRLVHPLWAIFKEKKINKNGKPPTPGTKNPSLDDFFFLIDPNKMICFCKPHADPWQLLKVKWEHRKFVKSPKFTQHYFTSGLMLPKKYNAIIYSDNGICVIDFDHQSYAEPTIDAKVKFIQEMSSDEMPANVNLNDYTVRAGSSTRKSVVIRFPVRGRYEVDVFGGTEAKEPKIVEFRIECDDVGRSPQPFPMNPANGFGLQPAASQFGISDPVPDSGIIQVRPAQVKHFSFTCTQKLEAQASLFHNTVNSESFEDFITTKAMPDEVHVTVAVPDEPHLEYALQVRNNESGKMKYKIASTQLTKKMNRQRIRKAIIAATQKNDIAKLEYAIEEFERNGLPDNGDLTRARHKLVQLH